MTNVKSFTRKSRNNYVNLNLIIILKSSTNEPVLSVKVFVPAGPLPMLFTANT